jgi:dihydrofolate synthase / folylpolyglutamate synthase
VREGLEYGVVGRVPAVGGQVVTLQGLRAEYDEVFLPLYGAHQAQNAAMALAAVEAFLGDRPLDADLVRAAFSRATSPGRLEIIRRSPMILLDAAHNPHGAESAAAALDDSFAFSPLVGVIGVMSDKEYEGVLAAFEPHLAHVVCTQNSTPRALPAAELAVTARAVFGGDRVSLVPRLADAIDEALALAEAGEVGGMSIGSGAVLITGSVVTVGEARAMLRRRDRTPGA